MRASLIIAALAVAGASTALAKTEAQPAAAQPVTNPPQAYNGYAQPDITQCQTPTPLLRECTVPSMTAGRYLIEAVAGATATAAGATQTLQIRIGGAPCISTAPAAFTGKEGLRVGCEVNFLTDRPITVQAVYAVQNGTADATGPKMGFRRIPWNGVVEARGLVFKAKPKAAAPAKK